MTQKCLAADCPAQPGLVWWTAYSTDETDAEVRKHAAQKLGVLPGHIELEHTGGCVLARVRGDEMTTLHCWTDEISRAFKGDDDDKSR